MTTTTVNAENENKSLALETNGEKKISKREAIIIHNFPPETSHRPSQFHRRKAPRTRLKLKPKTGYRYRTSNKRKPSMVKPHSYKNTYNRRPKPRYKSSPRKPTRGKKSPHHISKEPQRYGSYDEMARPNSYAEPPTDSYGAPLKINPAINEVYADAFANDDSETGYHMNEEFNTNYQSPEPQKWQAEQGFSYNDNAYALSQKYVKKTKPFGGTHQMLEDIPMDYIEEQCNSHSGSHNHKPHYLNSKKKPHFARTALKPKSKMQKEQILVGGQYAEPPARYVPKFQPSAPMFEGDDFTAPDGFKSFDDSEMAGSSVSSYVNYKYSNMAFSPQNLNDAFSVIN